ncbi:MAG: preprotein translocase subunit SecE [Myxococcota bacterium]
MSVNPTEWVRDARQYLTEVEFEARKITWPSPIEARAGTIGVLVLVLIVATVLGVVDFGLSRFLHWVLQ